MKKRKELDALVTNGTRAKLPSKKKSMPSKEEGHELLLNIESDSGSSLDLDFAPPKRTFVRKPHVCSLCLSGCVLVLLVASILMSIALLWMNFDLKKDVDGLRKRLELVEKESSISKSQLDAAGALVNGLEKNLNDSRARLKENVTRMDLKLLDIENKVSELNASSLSLKKVQSQIPKQTDTAADPQLKMVVAGLGSEVEELKGTVQDVQSSQKHQQEDIQSLSKNVADLQSTVSGMSQSASRETHPTSSPVNQSSKVNNTQISPANAAITSYLEQKLKKLSDTLESINSTLYTVEQEQSSFTERLKNVELLTHNIPLGVQGVDNGTLSLVDILKLQSDVKSLMAHADSVNSSSSNDGVNPHDIMTLRAQISVIQLTVDSLTDRLNKLNSGGLNNNLLNVNTTLGIQEVMTNSLQHFKEENLASFDEMNYMVTKVQEKAVAQQQAIDTLEKQLQEMHKLIIGIVNNNNSQASGTGKPVASSEKPVSITNSVPLLSNSTNTVETVTVTYDETGLATATKVATTPSIVRNENANLDTTPSPPPFGYLELPGVSKIEDVKARFNIWNMHKGYVTFEEMENFLGTSFKGKEQLEQFDYDHDSTLNESEIIAGFGFVDAHNRRRIGESSVPLDTSSEI